MNGLSCLIVRAIIGELHVVFFFHSIWPAAEKSILLLTKITPNRFQHPIIHTAGRQRHEVSRTLCVSVCMGAHYCRRCPLYRLLHVRLTH